MNINLIINISVYASLLIGLLTGFIIGIRRGVRKTSIRFGIFLILIIVAGFISRPIATLVNINISGLGIKVGGVVAADLTHLGQLLINSIAGIETIMESAPSLALFLNQLPIALLTLIVFFILVIIMQGVSWLIYFFISRFALKETKLERMLKKQRKMEIKALKMSKKSKNDENIPYVSYNPPFPAPKKYRLWGGVVGLIQSFVFLFLLFIPLSSALGLINEISSSQTSMSNTIYADEEEFLYESSSDLLETALGSDTINYIKTFNNSAPVKILSLAGFNNVIFDGLSKMNINKQNIYIRKEVVTVANIYDNYILILDEMGKEENLSDFNFKLIRNLYNLFFDSGIVSAFGEEGVNYAVSLVNSLEENSFPYLSEIQDSLDFLIKEYKDDPSGFMTSFKNDINCILNIGEVSLDLGLVDNFFLQNINIDNIINDIKKLDYKVINTLINEGFSSYIGKIATVQSLNILLDMGVEKLSDEFYTADLGTVVYKDIDWDSSKLSTYNILKNLVEIYDIINLYDINALISHPLQLLGEDGDNDFKDLVSLVGKEIDFINTSPLFNESLNPVIGTIDWLDNKEFAQKFIDTPAMLNVSSWQLILEPLSNSALGLKNSGIIDLLEENNIDIEELIDLSLSPISSDANSDIYLNYILSPIINSPISKNLTITLLNELNFILQENISSLTLNEFSRENFSFDQNDEIIEIIENVFDCYSIFSDNQEIDLETIDISKLSNLLTSLQNNAFRKNSSDSVEYNIDLINKTVVDGGVFANYYISFVTYIFGDSVNINYKTIDWHSFLSSSQELYSNFDNIIDNSSLDNLFNLGSEDYQENFEELLDSLGLDSSIAQNLIDINTAIDSLLDSETEISEDIYNLLDDAFNNLLNSQDSEGNNTIETLIDIIESITGQTISDEIGLNSIEKEQLVTTRLNLLHSLVYEINAENSTPDIIHADLNLLDATLQDLTCGATYVLQNFSDSGQKIKVAGIDADSLHNKIIAATDNIEIIELVEGLFSFAK